MTGRPAPQGSKTRGEHGQLRESSAYLPAWRRAVKRDTYRAYKTAGLLPEQLPLYTGAIGIEVVFYLPPQLQTFGKDGQRGSGPEDWRIDGPPDLDKLTRSTWDALTQARVWEDDGRVVRAALSKVEAGRLVLPHGGARIEVWRVEL